MNLIAAATSVHDSGSIGGHGTFHYLLIMALMMTGIYLILSRSNMVKSIIGLNMFQVAVIMFYVSIGRVEHGTAPILMKEDAPVVEDAHHEHDEEHDKAMPHHAPNPQKTTLSAKSGMKQASISQPTTSKATGIVYSNPLPHVLMLTAIVVGVATTALALSLVVRINEHYGTIEEDELEDIGALS